MANELQSQLEKVRALAEQQSLCEHPTSRRSFVANRTASGSLHVWWRCDDCWENLLGKGKWVPHEYLEATGVDVTTLELVEDRLRKNPPCRVCGALGTELHHWAPRRLFGGDADLWPTDYLCRACHTQWHTLVERRPVAVPQALPIAFEGSPGHVA